MQPRVVPESEAEVDYPHNFPMTRDVKITVATDIALECQICANPEFEERSAQLNTALMSFMGLDWLNKSARCFVCVHCGYVHWFLPRQ